MSDPILRPDNGRADSAAAETSSETVTEQTSAAATDTILEASAEPVDPALASGPASSSASDQVSGSLAGTTGAASSSPMVQTGGAGGSGGTGSSGQDASGLSSDNGSEFGGNLWIRALFMLGYGILAWFVFSVVLFLAVVQFIVGLVNKSLNDDLRGIVRQLVMYLTDLLAYISFLKDEKPFPLGKLPK